MSMSDDDVRKRYVEIPQTVRRELAKQYWPERDRYAEHRTQEELAELLHHAHPYPALHGHTDRYVAKYYPGWTWNLLVSTMTKSGVFVNRGAAPGTCDPRVREVYFDGPDGWLVVLRSGRKTAGSAPPGTTSRY
jgi:hypothetical protein